MKDPIDYAKDLAEIRSMMERSSKFFSLSGWAGILAGLYALAGAWIAHSSFGFQPNKFAYSPENSGSVVLTATIVLTLALVTAFLDSWYKAKQHNEKVWNPTSKRMLAAMAVPLFAGGLLILILFLNGLSGMIAPLSLIFYGFALFNAGFYTVREIRLMGVVQIILGLLNALFIGYGLLFWAIGFGAVHLLYGIIMHFRYER